MATGHGSGASHRSGPSPAHAIGARKHPPPLSETSTAKDIAAFVAYYQRDGYTVKADRQTFMPDGTVRIFQFLATRHEGSDWASAGAKIDRAARTVCTSEGFGYTTTTSGRSHSVTSTAIATKK